MRRAATSDSWKFARLRKQLALSAKVARTPRRVAPEINASAPNQRATDPVSWALDFSAGTVQLGGNYAGNALAARRWLQTQLLGVCSHFGCAGMHAMKRCSAPWLQRQAFAILGRNPIRDEIALQPRTSAAANSGSRPRKRLVGPVMVRQYST